MNLCILFKSISWLLLTLQSFGYLQLQCPYTQWQQQYFNSLNIKTAKERNRNKITLKTYSTDHAELMDILRSIDISESASANIEIRKWPRSQFVVTTTKGTKPHMSCNHSTHMYYRTYDGSCNNFLYPGSGMAQCMYSRLLSPIYADGVQEPTRSITGAPLPNARLLSLTVYGEKTVPDDFRTLMLMQWSQLVAHDLSKFTTQGAPDNCCRHTNHRLCYPIILNPSEPIALATGRTCLHFARGLFGNNDHCGPLSNKLSYAEKVTVTSSYLDLGFIYGDSPEQNRKVRLFKRGLLKTDRRRALLPIIPNTNDECPSGSEHCFIMPDNRDQSTPLAIVLHVLFVREHNRLASRLFELNSHYSDERLFQEARKINIAQYQKIIYYDWLPLVLGRAHAFAIGLIHPLRTLGDYVNDYKQHINAAPFAEYAAAAFRYGHHQIPGWFSLVSTDRGSNQTLRMSNYFNAQHSIPLIEGGNNFDSLLRGLVTQLQKRSDDNIDKEIKHCFERKLFNEFGVDLKAMDIQRGRDFGVRSYNDFREYCGLSKAKDWSDFANEIAPHKIEIMRQLYTSPQDVDLNVGGSLEAHARGAIFGPTFQCILSKQFLKVRQADRFFFEHHNIFSGFNADQLAEIRKVSLAGLLCANGDHLKLMQRNVFVLPNKQNKLVDCKQFVRLNVKFWKDESLEAFFV